MTLPAAPDRVFGTFSAGVRRALPPMLPPADELPEGDVRDAIAAVEEVWSRLQPAQDEGAALFRERKLVNREDEQRRQQAAAEGKQLPKSKLQDADARLLELVDQVRPLCDAYQARRTGWPAWTRRPGRWWPPQPANRWTMINTP